MKHRKGFSLIELLAILLLISLVALIITPVVQNVIDKSIMRKYEVSYETLLRKIQVKPEKQKYVVIDGEVFPNLDYSGNIKGNGTITIDENGNAEVQIQVGESDYCVFKNYNTSKVNVKKGTCNEGMLAGFELQLVQGITTNHSISVAALLNGNADEYYFQINNGTWFLNETIGQNYYVFEELNYNSTYEIKAKAITASGIEVISDAAFFATVNVMNPEITAQKISNSVIVSIDFKQLNLEEYLYRYKIDEGAWQYVTEQIINIEPTKNNQNITAEVLNRNQDTMVSINQTVDYSIFASNPLLTVRSVQNGNVMDKYVDINYQEIIPFFEYQYKVNNSNFTKTTRQSESILLSENNSVIIAQVIDRNNLVMKEETITIPYYDDTEYSIFVNQSQHGTISIGQTEAKVGDVVQVTLSPDIDYTIDYLSINSITTSESSFIMQRENVTVTPTWKLALITKYRTRYWVSASCPTQSCGYNSWQCCSSSNNNYSCPCCTGAPSPNCQPQSQYGACCGHFYSCVSSSYDCSHWSDWSGWTTTECSVGSTCESKICKGDSPVNGCTEP